MRITLVLDDDLMRKAQEISGIAECSALIHEALSALVERDSARRLASLGGHDARFEKYSSAVTSSSRG